MTLRCPERFLRSHVHVGVHAHLLIHVDAHVQLDYLVPPAYTRTLAPLFDHTQQSGWAEVVRLT